MKVAVFGLGHVGTVTADGLASRGHEVVGVDIDNLKVESIQDGRSPVVDPGMDVPLANGVRSRGAGPPRRAAAGKRGHRMVWLECAQLDPPGAIRPCSPRTDASGTAGSSLP